MTDGPFSEEDLKKLQRGEGGEGGAPPDPGAGGEPSEDDLLDVELSPKEAADELIAIANKEFAEKGLSPVSTLQATLLRVGIIGVCKKYDITTISFGNFPELALALGVTWTTIDKVKEYKAKRQKKESEAAKAPEGDKHEIKKEGQ